MLSCALLLLGLSAPIHAQRVAGVPPASSFVPNMLVAVSVSMAQQPFYGSMLLNAFDLHLRQVAPMSEPQAAAYLKAAILGVGKGARSAPAFVAELGRSPLQEHQAAALLIANSFARPDQFREVLNGLEGIRPGLGKALQSRLAAGGDASGRFGDRLKRLGATFDARPENGTYNRRGELDALFDHSGDYPSY